MIKTRNFAKKWRECCMKNATIFFLYKKENTAELKNKNLNFTLYTDFLQRYAVNLFCSKAVVKVRSYIKF